MPHLPKLSTEETLFIIIGLIIIFIGIPLSLICGCCNNKCKKRNNPAVVSNSKLITNYP